MCRGLGRGREIGGRIGSEMDIGRREARREISNI